MHRFLVLFIVVSITLVAHPVSAQTADRQPKRGDGGLHVSNGGVIGSVGGSISGSVVGPGGGGGGSAPAPEGEDATPNSLTGGSVGPAIEAGGSSDDTAEAASTSSIPWLPLAAGTGLGLALLVFLTRRLRPAPH